MSPNTISTLVASAPARDRSRSRQATRRARWAAALSLFGAVTFAGARAARSQSPPPRASDGISLPSQSIAATDDVSATLLNPANLAFATGPEVRFLGLYTGDGSPIPVRGYALDAGTPLWLLGTGLRVDWMRPPDSAPPPFAWSEQAQPFEWVRWGLAIRLGDWAALGSTLAWSIASSPVLDGLFSATAGLTVRPSNFLSAALVLRDYNAPENDAGFHIDRSVDLGLALRPIEGRRALEVGLETSYRAGSERWVPSVSLAAELPYIGRLRTGVQMLDPGAASVVINAGLDVDLGNYQLSGGGVYGSALSMDGAGFYAGAALRSFESEPSVPMPAKVVRVRLETTPNLRQHTRFLKALWRLSRDHEVEGVVLELRDAPAGSLAATEELADAVKLLRQRGKKVLCHLEDADGRALYLCAHADRVAINPAGGIRFAGISSRYFYFGGLLEKLGVQADFVRIGAHKLAPEQLTTEGGSDTGRQDHMSAVRAIEDAYLDAIVRGRKLDRDTARERIAGGPYIAREAREAKLVDTLAYQDEIERFVEESLGHSVRLVDLDLPDQPPAYWGEPPKIAIVYLDGEMVDGQSRTIPLLNIKLAGSYTVAKALKQAREDPTVHAVVLRVDTGGGSALAADVILREVTLTARAKPLIVSMAAKAASGGYYAAVGGLELFASRATLTGSIGIFYGKVDVVGLMNKLGVKSESFEGMPRADTESWFRPYTDDERRELGLKVKQLYDLFIGRVSEARGMTPAEVHAVAQGRVWTGDQALERHLIDRIGGLRQALERARQLSGLPDDAVIEELPDEPTSLLSLVLQAIGMPLINAQGSDWTPPPIGEIARALVPFMMFEASKPLALMDLSVRDP